MAKKEKEIEEVAEVLEVEAVEAETPKAVVNERWAEFLAKYEKSNPAKFALRKAAGELEKPPVGF